MNLNTTDDIDQFHKLVGSNVKKYREKKGLSQMQLSYEIGQNSTSIISQAELGKGKRFNLTHLYKMSTVLDCDICDFFIKTHS